MSLELSNSEKKVTTVVDHDGLESPKNDQNMIDDDQSNFDETLTDESEDEWDGDSEEEEVERDTNCDTIYVIKINDVCDEYYNDYNDAFEHAKYLGNVLASQVYNGKIEFNECHTEVRVVSICEGWLWDTSYVHKVIKIIEVVPN
jgi:hypothetical protein